MDYKFCKRRIYDELQQQRDIHLLKLFMRHNQFVRGHQLKVMDEMFSVFDTAFNFFFKRKKKKLKRGVRSCSPLGWATSYELIHEGQETKSLHTNWDSFARLGGPILQPHSGRGWAMNICGFVEWKAWSSASGSSDRIRMWCRVDIQEVSLLFKCFSRSLTILDLQHDNKPKHVTCWLQAWTLQ